MKQGPVEAYARYAFSRRLLLLTTAMHAVPLLALAQPAPSARPRDGQVVAGQASIAQTAARTTVSQSSQRAAVDWKGFDVGASHTVQFAQPGASAITLNRVTGPNPSEIAGRIEANGQVVIVNQAGVLFHKGAQIDTAGLVATASGISNGDFMAGRMVFDQNARPGARVENRGSITIRDRGLAALVAPQVANAGVIRAPLGTVMLAGAEAHRLDLYGDGMVGINVTRQVHTAPDGTKALVTNTGTIAATGGTVVLTAEAVDGLVQTLVNAGGHVSADTMGGRAGRVVASGRGGDVIVTGTLAANGVDPGTRGGGVTVNATGTVALGAEARISASGQAGGGTVAIGTTTTRATGGPTVTSQDTARATLISRGARIEADATRSGQGGVVTVLSTDITRMEGAITARGISRGGAVEVSGRRVSSLAGQIDVSASVGPAGTILIDPDFLDIVSGVAGSGSQDKFASDGTIVAGDASVPPDTISTGVLNGLVGDVLLQANQTISVKGDVTLTNTPARSLVLEAGGTITIDPGVRITTSGDVTLATGGGGPFAPPPGGAAPLISVQGTILSNPGTVSLLAGTQGSITIGGSIIAGAITLDAPAGIGLTGSASVGQLGGAITLRSQNGGIQQAVTARLVADRLEAPAGIAGQVFLRGPNLVRSLGSFAVTGSGNSLILVNAVDIAIDGPLTVPHDIGIATTSAERITINGTIANATGALTLRPGAGGIVLNSGAVVPIGRIGMTADNTISLAAGARLGVAGALIDLATSAGGVAQAAGATIIADTLRSTLGISGELLLLGRNTIAATGALPVSGNVVLHDNAPLVVTGTIATGGGAYLRTSDTAGITIDPGGAVVTGSDGIAGFHAPRLRVGGTVIAGAFAFAPETTGAPVDLGGTASALDSLLRVSASGATIGGVTIPGVGTTVSAGPITVTAPFDANAMPLRLLSLGGIDAATAPLRRVAALSGSAGASVTVTHAATGIGSLGPFAVGGANADLAVSSPATLPVLGPVSATRDVALLSGGDVSVTGAVMAGRTLAVSALGGSISTANASLAAPRIVFASQGSIALGPATLLGQPAAVVDLTAGAGGVSQDPSGRIDAAMLLSSGGIVGDLSLPSAGNRIGVLGSAAVTGPGASVLLVDADPLRIEGPVAAQGNIAITAPGIAVAGAMTARAQLTLTAARDGLAVQTAATIRAGGPVSLTAGGDVTQDGTVLTVNAGLVALTGASITQSATGLIEASAVGGAIRLTAAQLIRADGALIARDASVGAVTLTAGGGAGVQAITQNATILAGQSIALAAAQGDISHGGSAIADRVTIAPVNGDWSQPSGLIQARSAPFTLTSSGTVSQGAGATLAAPGAITLTAGQGLVQAGTLTTPGGAIALTTSAGGLSATGAMTAAQVRIANPAGQIVVGGRIDGLTPARLQSESQFAISARDFPTPTDPAGVFIVTGPGIAGQAVGFTANVAATSGRGQVLVTVPNDAPLSLHAESRNADLFLSLQRGSASGLLRVGSLHLRYTGTGTTETVDFAGSVNGLSGYSAAAGAFILPSLLPNYMLNGCAIQSVNCFQISDLRVPVTNPLKDVQTGGGGRGGAAQSLLPDVAERDY